MMRIVGPVLAVLVAAGMARADEFVEVLDDARAAYEAGDYATAAEDLAYAQQLLAGMKAAGLGAFLPEPLEGWTRIEGGDGGMALGLAMMGGGTAAGATYVRNGTEFEITLVADSPMVTGMAAMFSGAAMGAMGGQTVRIQRQQFLVKDDEVQGMIGGRVLLNATGQDTDAIIAHIEAMDLAGLAAY